MEAKEAPATIPPTEANEAAESANDAAAYGAAAHDAAAESAREAAAESAHEAAAKSAHNAAAKVTVVKDDKMEKASKKKDVEERKKRKKSRKTVKTHPRKPVSLLLGSSLRVLTLMTSSPPPLLNQALPLFPPPSQPSLLDPRSLPLTSFSPPLPR